MLSWDIVISEWVFKKLWKDLHLSLESVLHCDRKRLSHFLSPLSYLLDVYEFEALHDDPFFN